MPMEIEHVIHQGNAFLFISSYNIRGIRAQTNPANCEISKAIGFYEIVGGIQLMNAAE